MAFGEPLVMLLHEFCGSSVTLKEGGEIVIEYSFSAILFLNSMIRK